MTFVKDQKVYLLDGRKAVFVTELGMDSFVVAPIWQNDDEDEFTEDSIIVSHVFTAPPTKVFSNEITRLMDSITSLRDSEEKLRDEIARLHVDGVAELEAAKKRLEATKKLKGLERIEDFINGKFTHYLEDHYGRLIIRKFPDDLQCKDECSGVKRLRLISLFGRTDGDLEWRVNNYSDGSGNDTLIRKMGSREECVEEIKRIAQDAYDKLEGVFDYDVYFHYSEAAKLYGFECPKVITDALKQLLIKNKKGQVQKTQYALGLQFAELKALEEG